MCKPYHTGTTVPTPWNKTSSALASTKGFTPWARGASWIMTTESIRRQSTALPQLRDEDPHIIGCPWPPPGCPWLPLAAPWPPIGCPWLPLAAPRLPLAAPGYPLAAPRLPLAAPGRPPGCPRLPPGRPPRCPPLPPLMSAQAASDSSTLLPPTLGYNHLDEAPNPCPFITPSRTEEPPSTPSAPNPTQILPPE